VGYIAAGLFVTAQITVGAAMIGTAIGLIAAACRLSRFWWLRAPVSVYIEVIRNTPALLQLFLIYFGLAEIGIRLSALTSAILTMGILGGAFLTEIFRAGILSVDKGQMEAALSIGMGYLQVMRRVVLPQAMRLVIPPSTNFLIGLIKDTSLVLTISVPEVMYRAYNVASLTYQSIYVFALAGMIYFAACFPLSRLALRLEGRLAPR
jgi:His/Glu/Gln/Arg/opine family amino acid ABC transporter permease subunit